MEQEQIPQEDVGCPVSERELVKTKLQRMSEIKKEESVACESLDVEISDMQESLDRLLQLRNIKSADFVKARAELEEQIRDVMDAVGESVSGTAGKITYRKGYVRESIGMKELRVEFEIDPLLKTRLKPFIKVSPIEPSVKIEVH